ncbi:MAG: radical SAM/SPASM domain-containing protein [Candidatus Eremiobacterota bacterium]
MDKYQIDGHKLYWHMDRLIEWQNKKIIPPIYLEISPVSYCNHRCIFCGVDFAMAKAISIDKNIFLKKIQEMGQIGIRSIMYAGEGEPLLHNDLPEFVKATKENNIDVSITTNGTTGNYEIWKEILPFLSWIKFSVDAGTDQIYSKVHRVSEKLFYKTLESINEAIKVKKDYNLPVTIGIQYLIIEENIDDIEEAIKLFSTMEISYMVLKPYSLHPQMMEKKYVFYDEEKKKFTQNLVDEYSQKNKLNIIFRKNTMEKYIEGAKTYSHCYALPFWGYISSSGDFYTCSVFIGNDKFKAGNIYEDNMNDIIFGSKRKGSIEYGEKYLIIKDECRVNCRMARINEFLEHLSNKPEHINFI